MSDSLGRRSADRHLLTGDLVDAGQVVGCEAHPRGGCGGADLRGCSATDDFQRTYPGIELRLWQAGPAAQLAALREGRLDLSFIPLIDPPGSDLAVTPLHADRLVFACAPDHTLASRRRIHLRDVTREQFIDLPSDWTVRLLVDRAFRAAGLERRTGIEVNDLNTCLELVRRGVGVTILPESAQGRGTGIAFRPLARRIMWELVVARRADGPGNPAARELLRRVLGSGAPAG